MSTHQACLNSQIRAYCMGSRDPVHELYTFASGSHFLKAHEIAIKIHLLHTAISEKGFNYPFFHVLGMFCLTSLCCVYSYNSSAGFH